MVPAFQNEEKLINTLFDESSDRFSKRIAVEYGARSLSYGELKHRAKGFARSLARLGMPKRSVVGIYLDRSMEYIIAMLGALEAGMVFMPLNTGFPDKRLCSILEKTCPQVLVTVPENESDLHRKIEGSETPEPPKGVFVFQRTSGLNGNSLGDERTGYTGACADNPSELIDDDLKDACYVLTTSGSTGEPKAILGSHRGLAHFVKWEIREFGFDQKVRVSQLSPVTFDVSLRDILVPLVAGGCVCIPENEILQNPAAFLRWMREKEISVTHIVPTLFRILTKTIADEKHASEPLPHLEYVLLAGEPVYGNDIDNWRRAAGERSKLVNLYGPSETTLAKLFHRIDDAGLGEREIVPIGKPTPDTEVLIVNNEKGCSSGEAGEIYIKTPFMSMGYYRNRELTVKHFVQNPLRNDATDIVYKTGDQGEFGRDGTVRFLGRVDGQIKLYGKRIELAEIEVVLRQHKGVRLAAAAVREDTFGNLRLVAYIVPERGKRPTVESLRGFLRDRLPDYMLPHVFVYLQALPVTHNGKVDRLALPIPGRERPEMERPYVPPASEHEKTLCDIWEQILALDKVGVQDGFFDLGGTSVLAMRMVELIREVLQTEVPIVKVFQYPSVSLLSQYMQGLSQNRQSYEKLDQRAQRRRAMRTSRTR